MEVTCWHTNSKQTNQTVYFSKVLEGRPQYIEMAGNLIPVTKSGDQLHVNFKAFRENRLPCTLKIRDPDQEAAARVAFMKEPKLARGEAPQTPICNLNIRLPDTISVSCGCWCGRVVVVLVMVCVCLCMCEGDVCVWWQVHCFCLLFVCSINLVIRKYLMIVLWYDMSSRVYDLICDVWTVFFLLISED